MPPRWSARDAQNATAKRLKPAIFVIGPRRFRASTMRQFPHRNEIPFESLDPDDPAPRTTEVSPSRPRIRSCRSATALALAPTMRVIATISG